MERENESEMMDRKMEQNNVCNGIVQEENLRTFFMSNETCFIKKNVSPTIRLDLAFV